MRILCLALVVGQMFFTTGCGGPLINETIQIKEISERYELTVPVSQLIMTIPKGGLQQKNNYVGGATNNPRYFIFEDRSQRLILSGWFESEQKFSGLKNFWDKATKNRTGRGQFEPQDVSFMEIDRWKVIMYNIPISPGAHAKSRLNMRAHWLQAGTWIDLHISMTSNRPSAESRPQLIDFLKTVQIKEKI